jgi:hypothetical protein
MGLDGGLSAKTRQGRNMHRLRSADLCVDRQDGSEDDEDDDASKSTLHYCIVIAMDVRWCKRRFTCNIKPTCRGISCASKHASPTFTLGHIIAWSAVYMFTSPEWKKQAVGSGIVQ